VRLAAVVDKHAQLAGVTSIFLPVRIYPQGPTPTARANRSYLIMTTFFPPSPRKGERHRLRSAYTLCLVGLSFFLFILLTGHRIFLIVLLPADRHRGLTRTCMRWKRR